MNGSKTNVFSNKPLLFLSYEYLFLPYMLVSSQGHELITFRELSHQNWWEVGRRQVLLPHDAPFILILSWKRHSIHQHPHFRFISHCASSCCVSVWKFATLTTTSKTFPAGALCHLQTQGPPCNRLFESLIESVLLSLSSAAPSAALFSNSRKHSEVLKSPFNSRTCQSYCKAAIAAHDPEHLTSLTHHCGCTARQLIWCETYPWFCLCPHTWLPDFPCIYR